MIKDLVQEYIDEVGYVDIKDYGNIDLLEDLAIITKWNHYNCCPYVKEQPTRFTEEEYYSEILRRMRKSFSIDVSQ